jgi:hypothetical protein
MSTAPPSDDPERVNRAINAASAAAANLVNEYALLFTRREDYATLEALARRVQAVVVEVAVAVLDEAP